MRAMSKERQQRFEQWVTRTASATSGALKLGPPVFERIGFVTHALLQGSDGQVELRCGPPDYSVEVFIHTSSDGKRWTLLDLMQLGGVKEWLETNRPQPGEQDETYAFRFLCDGLRGPAEFAWLYAQSAG
jgi:hypothetical protein